MSRLTALAAETTGHDEVKRTSRESRRFVAHFGLSAERARQALTPRPRSVRAWRPGCGSPVVPRSSTREKAVPGPSSRWQNPKLKRSRALRLTVEWQAEFTRRRCPCRLHLTATDASSCPAKFHLAWRAYRSNRRSYARPPASVSCPLPGPPSRSHDRLSISFGRQFFLHHLR